MLAYYSMAADQEFWSEHWGGQSAEALLVIARTSQLAEILARSLPGHGRVLEAGCGLGQYVLLLRERGWAAVGVDWSQTALAACRNFRPAPLAAMNLRGLAVHDGAFAAYVSLGVVEHDPEGPDAILAEARRVLSPGGVALVSVPYLNTVRRVAAPWISHRNRAIRSAGGCFYQYVFSRRELVATLVRHGFLVRSLHQYGAAYFLRRLLPAAVRPAFRGEQRTDMNSRCTADLRSLARRLLYKDWAGRMLGHMLLAVAVKP